MKATFVLLIAAACATHETAEVRIEPLPPPPVASAVVSPPRRATPAIDVRADGLEIEDLRVGTGDELVPGSTAVVHYVGTLPDGTEFDSSRTRGTPFTTKIPGPVIKGWNEGLPGMRVGGLRRITIPAPLGYGSRGAPPKIPADATLIFEIELLEVR